MANFNFSGTPNYNLNTSLIEEVINLYGILVKFLVVEKINRDDVVFGDYSHLKSDSTKIYDIYMLPEESENFISIDSAFNGFGLTNSETINLFMPASALATIGLTKGLTGNLIVLPNNKVMEITQESWETPGMNNLFTNIDVKSVIKLSCKAYDFKLITELNSVDIVHDASVPYTTLDSYFTELITQTTTQNNTAAVTPTVTTVQKTGTNDIKVQKPIVDKTEKDLWNGF